MVRGELGDELAIRHPGRGGQPGFGADAGADLLGDGARAAQAMAVLADVEIGLVEAQRLDQVGVIGKDGADLVADRLVGVEARLDEDEVGAAPPRGDRRHRGPHPEHPRFVTRRGNHPAMPAADRDRAPAQRRVVALFDAGVKRIHVDVDDLALAG